MIRSWQVEAAANLTISAAYLAIAILIIVPIVRMHQLRNKLAVATAAIFFSCAAGHFVHFVMPLLQGGAGMAAEHVSTWWTAGVHAVTACAALYYLSLRRFYGQLLSTAPMFHDLVQQQRLSDLEAFRAESMARAAAEGERDFTVSLMSSINEHSPSLIYVKDLDGRYLMVNRAFEQTFHIGKDELVGQTFDVIDPTVRDLWQRRDEEAHAGPVHQEGSAVIGAETHYFETTKFPVLDHRGDLYGTCGPAHPGPAAQQPRHAVHHG